MGPSSANECIRHGQLLAWVGWSALPPGCLRGCGSLNLSSSWERFEQLPTRFMPAWPLSAYRTRLPQHLVWALLSAPELCRVPQRTDKDEYLAEGLSVSWSSSEPRLQIQGPCSVHFAWPLLGRQGENFNDSSLVHHIHALPVVRIVNLLSLYFYDGKIYIT